MQHRVLVIHLGLIAIDAEMSKRKTWCPCPISMSSGKKLDEIHGLIEKSRIEMVINPTLVSIE